MTLTKEEIAGIIQTLGDMGRDLEGKLEFTQDVLELYDQLHDEETSNGFVDYESKLISNTLLVLGGIHNMEKAKRIAHGIATLLTGMLAVGIKIGEERHSAISSTLSGMGGVLE